MDLQAPRAVRPRSLTPQHALSAVPFAMIVLVSVGDLLAPPDVHLGPFLAAAPAVAASFAGPRTTAFIGAVAVLAQVIVAMVRGSVTDLNHSFQIITLLLISVFVTFFAHLREVHEKELVQLRSVAEAAQLVVLRPLRERVGPLRVASVYMAAAAEAQIGGDLYAAARTAHGTRLIIGDVRGKGLEAVGDAALVLGAFRAAAHQEADLPSLAAYLERAVAPDLDGSQAQGPFSEGEGGFDTHGEGDTSVGYRSDDPGEAFITAALLDIPDTGQALRLVNCGHPPPLLLRGNRVIPLEVDQPAPPLGLVSLAPSQLLAESFPFEPGDILLLYTDGVLEARDAHGGFYPLAERAAAWNGTGPHALLRHLRDDLLAHTPAGSLGDDAAMVAIERLRPPADPAPAAPPPPSV
ncbi:PP2C family protein-serine/threonine phosphatase [Streptomyces sp. NBC_00083]|uniref:PP2C family protein-serine/threonine phosphatase n=1 Tax=Streptomyces sp. NBC_00083 TaxID=2975647 RepID=UPI0022529379|nr:PP2C family protein-serine/threonine phosphatase [Streptomyces sp. NBC_00083]MCX5384088.1 serine/threonine-protein phosphatase [Streptomyces sp. NBC_00083]